MSNANAVDARRTIQKWKESLTDFSARNPLLYFKPTKSSTLQIADDPAQLYTLLASHKTIPVSVLHPLMPPPPADGSPVEEPNVEAICTKLRRRAKTHLEETGLSPLTLAFDLCEWDSPDANARQINGAARRYRAPVLLMPVTLQRPSSHGTTLLSYDGGEILINPVLRRALQRDFNLTIPDEPDDVEPSLAAMLSRVDVLRSDGRLQFKPAVVLGLFSFSRLVMVDDLERNEEQILSHPILGTLLGTKEPLDNAPPMDPRDLDAYYDKHHPLTVIDADSSQQVAIEAAKAGRSIVIQGPPGTGKSQTITNIIAEMLADGKRVLFVSAKRAALEVVLRRMEGAGLGDLCLDAHSDGVDKRKVVAGLYQACENARNYSSQVRSDVTRLDKLRQDRKAIDDHVSVLHAHYDDMDMSVFQAYGILCAEVDRPALPLTVKTPSFFTSAHLERFMGNVSDVAKHADLVMGTTQSLWHLTLLKDPLDYTRQAEIAEWLTRLDTNINTVAAAVREIADIVGLAAPEMREKALCWTIDVARALVVAPHVESDWFTPAQRQRREEEYQRFAQDIASYHRDWNTTLATYDAGVFALPLDGIRERLDGPFASVFKRLTSRQYRRDRATLRALRSTGKPSYEELRAEVGTAIAARDRKIAIDGNQEAGHLFGRRYRGVETDVDELHQTISWTARYVELTEGKADPRTTYDRVVEAGITLARLERLCDEASAALSQIEQAKQRVRSLFPSTILRDWDGDMDLALAQQTAVRLRGEIPLLVAWLDYQQARRQMSDAGFPNVIEQIKALALPASEWVPAFRRGFISAWVDYQHSVQPALGTFKGQAHEGVIDEFKSLDLESIEHAQQIIRAKHARTVQDFLANDKTRQYTRLASEAAKKRQVWPVRKLLGAIPELLLQVKPCWMMSPLSVTQMVDASRVHFDAVIFDEASQIRAEEAACAILRANQVIVVGDDKQLPPTSFFSLSMQDDIDEEQESDVFESILDQCAVHLQRHMLRWHYRSRDESLIAFSNQTYYYNQLVTFPSADHREGSGVSFHFVADAVYDRGNSRTNKKEAQETARMICEHYASQSKRSLGVIALSQAQQTAIQDALEEELRRRLDLEVPEDGPDALFIKNLENVQGDERDVIFLSIGYGKDETGQLSLNFGPINKAGGGRRLNVAVTRARQAITVISSIHADDIDTRRSSSDALHQLRDYLVYAESNGRRLEHTVFNGPATFDSPFEEDVWQMLVDRGYQVHSQVGCSRYRIDLAVVDHTHPGRYLLGIECDGATYHSSPTARDRDRLRQSVLEGLGWTIHRIWSRDWMRDKRAEVERIEQRVRQLQQSTASDARVVKMDLCPHCGGGVRRGARYCGHCRHVVA